MSSFVITLMRFFSAFVRSLNDPEFRALFAVLVGLLLSGTLFYTTVEGWAVIDSLYFSVMTLATVGYGDLAPSTDLSKIFTVMYVIVGAGVFLGFIAKLKSFVRTNRTLKIRAESSGHTVGSEFACQ